MSSASDALTLFRPTVAEIDVDAFRRNIAAVRAMLPYESQLIAVLKADAYGHGALAMGHVCAEEGVAMLAVALLEEALELRDRGVRAPILVLGPLISAQIPAAAASDITIGVIGPEELRDVCRFSRQNGREVTIHLKLDSGMGRMGLLPGDLDDAARLLLDAPGVRVDAIYSHFANASDPDPSSVEGQVVQFDAMVARLERLGITPSLRHFANSAATFRKIIRPGDWVRVGLAIFGGEPLDDQHARLEPVLRWSTQIARIKQLPPGSPIGYGSTFVTTRDSLIATLPVGYGDGYNRALSNCGEVLVRGQRAPVVGRVSMDLVTIDVTDIPGVRYGDEAVLIGEQGGERITAEEIAAKIGTIPYEVLCAISVRVPRIYESRGRVLVASRFRDERRAWPGAEE